MPRTRDQYELDTLNDIHRFLGMGTPDDIEYACDLFAAVFERN